VCNVLVVVAVVLFLFLVLCSFLKRFRKCMSRINGDNDLSLVLIPNRLSASRPDGSVIEFDFSYASNSWRVVNVCNMQIFSLFFFLTLLYYPAVSALFVFYNQ
jgi:hypothetical protein